MTNLLLTHSRDSNKRISRGLDPFGIECIEIDPYGTIYEMSQPDMDIDVGLVYPSRIMEAGFLDSRWDIPWVNDMDEILMTRNKARSILELEKNGINTPETWYVSSPADFRDLSSQIDGCYPILAKPNSSTKGEGLVKIDEMDSLRGVFDYFSVMHESSLVGDRSFILQEFLGDMRDFRVMIVDGEFVGGVERVSDGWKKNVHRGGEVINKDVPMSVIDIAENAASVLDVSFCGVDVLFGEEPFVIEVNGRPTVDEEHLYLDDFYEKLANVVLKVSEK